MYKFIIVAFRKETATPTQQPSASSCWTPVKHDLTDLADDEMSPNLSPTRGESNY